MGSRGPAKSPTAIRVLHGESRASQLNHAEPKPGGTPRIPTGTSPASRKVWRRIVRDYGDTGVLTAADADILRSYCDAVARYEQAAVLLEQMGPVVRGARRGDLVKNPLHQIVRDNAVLVRSLARELGLTPSSRTGLSGNARPTGDPLDAFLEGVG